MSGRTSHEIWCGNVNLCLKKLPSPSPEFLFLAPLCQSLSRAVTRISKDLLVVTLGEHDRPAKPPPARAASGTTTETMRAELEAWHASSGLEGVLTPDCHDPDPPISRALVDARHTFLEMCQVNGIVSCITFLSLGRLLCVLCFRSVKCRFSGRQM